MALTAQEALLSSGSLGATDLIQTAFGRFRGREVVIFFRTEQMILVQYASGLEDSYSKGMFPSHLLFWAFPPLSTTGVLKGAQLKETGERMNTPPPCQVSERNNPSHG